MSNSDISTKTRLTSPHQNLFSDQHGILNTLAKGNITSKAPTLQEKSPVIAKCPQGHWSHDNIDSFISMWDFSSPFILHSHKLLKQQTLGLRCWQNLYDRPMLMLSQQFCFSVCIYFVVPFS